MFTAYLCQHFGVANLISSPINFQLCQLRRIRPGVRLKYTLNIRIRDNCGYCLDSIIGLTMKNFAIKQS